MILNAGDVNYASIQVAVLFVLVFYNVEKLREVLAKSTRMIMTCHIHLEGM